MHLRRPAGDVQDRNILTLQESDDRIQGGRVHRLLAVGIGIGVAVQAGEVAAQAYVDLQGLQFAARDGGEIGRLQMGQGLMHGRGSRPAFAGLTLYIDTASGKAADRHATAIPFYFLRSALD